MKLPTPSAEQRAVINALLRSKGHAFVTGKAGTGKTTVLHWFQEETNKKIAIVAPTGIAALNAGGGTIHRTIGLGTGLPADEDIDKAKIKSKRGAYLKSLDVLVVDEVSMVNADMMDSMDRMLRYHRDIDTEPFGGLQVIMFGDVYQLPPVVKDEDRAYYDFLGYRSPWFFDAHVWEEEPMTLHALEVVHRQSNPDDEYFKTLLNGVRDASITPEQLLHLNMAGHRNVKTDDSILLAARRVEVADRNKEALKALKTKKYVYQARVNTGFGRDEPADRLLELKEGAHVMMLNNDTEDRWVNGTQAVVASLGEDSISVEIDGTRHSVGRFAWVPDGTPPERYPDAPKYHQFPVKLAWAITIHKSQGLSLDAVEIDLGPWGVKTPGQTYVALSRLRESGGLTLRTPIRMSDVKVDPHVLRYFTDNLTALV